MRARNLRKAGRLEDSVNEFMISARLRPNEPDAYVELANVFISMDRVPEAVEQLKLALNAEPEHPSALSILAFHAITTGNEAEARQWLERVGNQPRVAKDSAAGLTNAYRLQFGRDWEWRHPR